LHVVDDGVEQRLHALVLEGGAGEHGHEGVVQGPLADALLEVLDGRLLALKVGHHDVVVLLDDHLVGVGVGVGVGVRVSVLVMKLTSSSLPRHSCAFSSMSAGMSVTSNLAPRDSSFW